MPGVVDEGGCAFAGDDTVGVEVVDGEIVRRPSVRRTRSESINGDRGTFSRKQQIAFVQIRGVPPLLMQSQSRDLPAPSLTGLRISRQHEIAHLKRRDRTCPFVQWRNLLPEAFYTTLTVH